MSSQQESIQTPDNSARGSAAAESTAAENALQLLEESHAMLQEAAACMQRAQLRLQGKLAPDLSPPTPQPKQARLSRAARLRKRRADKQAAQLQRLPALET